MIFSCRTENSGFSSHRTKNSDYRNKIQKGPPREEQAGRQGIRVTGTVGHRRDMVEEGRKSQERTGRYRHV
ncbi:hypothetical protein Avbf_13308 [Armadillidium vulgare]|nr:hypothetical protein Avbf_13308 [Armadillidium vulgare]